MNASRPSATKQAHLIKEAIILAGGLGTRLRSTVPDLPKCLAPVAGRPFLSFVIDHLRMQGIERFIFSLGYQSEKIEAFLNKDYPTLDHVNVIEEEPLGTGGAIRLAMEKAATPHVLVANGDTIFRFRMETMEHLHLEKAAACTLALKPMKDFDRYGVVEIDQEGRITSFREKQHYASGLINAGVYLLDREKFMSIGFPLKFSFEKDFLEARCSMGEFFGAVQEGYFIDIGIAEDYRKAGIDLQPEPLDLEAITSEWTLFLDRDGVINEEKVGEYVKHWNEFIFSKGVLEVFKKLSHRFGRIIIVSNQRGVGRGLMSEADLQSIHLEMQREVEIVQGRIDRIYYCTEKDDLCFFRKPNPGMAWQAVQDFPDIDLSKSIMVGNKPGDMRFGRAAGMFTVFVKTTNPNEPFPHPDVDLVFPTLADFAHAVEP